VNNKISYQDKENIKRFSEYVAIAAQIKNDLDDIIGIKDEEYEVPMKDLQEKMLNYPTALFFNVASVEDKERFLNEYWGYNITPKIIKGIIEMLGRYNVFGQCIAEIDRRISLALVSIKNLSHPYRGLLTRWVESYRINQEELQKWVR